MKKKVLGIVAAVAVVAIAGVNYLQMNQDVELSDLALANVEALANEEWGGGRYCQWDSSNYYCTRYASGPICLLTNC